MNKKFGQWTLNGLWTAVILSICTLINSPVGASLLQGPLKQYKEFREKPDVQKILKKCNEQDETDCSNDYKTVTATLSKPRRTSDDNRQLIFEFDRLLKSQSNTHWTPTNDDLKTLHSVKKAINEDIFLPGVEFKINDRGKLWHTLSLKHFLDEDSNKIEVDERIADATCFDVAKAINDVFKEKTRDVDREKWLAIFNKGQDADFTKAVKAVSKDSSESSDRLPEDVKNQVKDNLKNKQSKLDTLSKEKTQAQNTASKPQPNQRVKSKKTKRGSRRRKKKGSLFSRINRSFKKSKRKSKKRKNKRFKNANAKVVNSQRLVQSRPTTTNTNNQPASERIEI